MGGLKMLGTIVNALAVAGGCIIGLIVKGKLNEKISNTIMNGLALCVIYRDKWYA